LRLLLDAHVSARIIGRRLKAAGHDVLALDHHAEFEGLDDEAVLELAVAERRIVVTRNVADFPLILREWAESGRSHAGLILVYGIGHHEFDLAGRGIERLLAVRGAQAAWIDSPAVLDRSSATVT
jgi:hypothetical protein